MSDELARWSSIIPEITFDVIGKIPPGAFLTLIVVGALISNPQAIPSALAKLEWGPAFGLLMMLLFASYATGLLIAPVGELANRPFWFLAWRKLGARNFHLLKDIEKLLHLGFPLTAASGLKAWQWDMIYGRLHTYLKKEDSDAKAMLPKLAAEVQLSSNCIIVFLAALFLVWLRSGWRRLDVLLLCIATGLAIYSAQKRTSRFIQRHFAFLAATIKNPRN